MTSVRFARWEIECDAAVTLDLFSRLTSGAAEACGCAPCLNFAAARRQIYPADALRLFDLLGVAIDREAEVYHTHRIKPCKHHYAGWFHFVGKIISGSGAAKQIGTNVWTPDLEEVSAEFQLGFTDRVALLEDPFKGHSVVQLEFQAAAPWLIAEPEPTR